MLVFFGSEFDSCVEFYGPNKMRKKQIMTEKLAITHVGVSVRGDNEFEWTRFAQEFHTNLLSQPKES